MNDRIRHSFLFQILSCYGRVPYCHKLINCKRNLAILFTYIFPIIMSPCGADWILQITSKSDRMRRVKNFEKGFVSELVEFIQMQVEKICNIDDRSILQNRRIYTYSRKRLKSKANI